MLSEPFSLDSTLPTHSWKVEGQEFEFRKPQRWDWWAQIFVAGGVRWHLEAELRSLENTGKNYTPHQMCFLIVVSERRWWSTRLPQPPCTRHRTWRKACFAFSLCCFSQEQQRVQRLQGYWIYTWLAPHQDGPAASGAVKSLHQAHMGSQGQPRPCAYWSMWTRRLFPPVSCMYVGFHTCFSPPRDLHFTIF